MFFYPLTSAPPSDVFPAQMEGVKLVINKVLSSHFQVLHLLPPPHMPAPLPSQSSTFHWGRGLEI